jgi:hypothetical protein
VGVGKDANDSDSSRRDRPNNRTLRLVRNQNRLQSRLGPQRLDDRERKTDATDYDKYRLFINLIVMRSFRFIDVDIFTSGHGHGAAAARRGAEESHVAL